MSNPFKKIAKSSNETSKKWGSAKETSETSARKCEQCGAPRPENTNLTTCDFCGFKFMDIDVIVKSTKSNE